MGVWAINKHLRLLVYTTRSNCNQIIVRKPAKLVLLQPVQLLLTISSKPLVSEHYQRLICCTFVIFLYQQLTSAEKCYYYHYYYEKEIQQAANVKIIDPKVCFILYLYEKKNNLLVSIIVVV